ncbi:MAG: glycosyltransferase family 39 protein, partial [Caldilineaceae bacterium]|nr:glycosyltransferase family 39 protein [Caldilineaceae bacterium]
MTLRPERMKRRSITGTSLIVLLLLGVGLRFYGIGSKAVWLDEAFSIWLANQPLSALWGWLVRIDQHPPLYYTLLHFWQLCFGDLQGVVRMLSALCSTLTLPFFYGFSRRFTDQPGALIATLLLTISPFHIRYAQEARMYALLTLAVAVALYLLAPLLLDRLPPANWRWTAFAIAQAAAMLTHNTAAVFLPLALNLAIGGALWWRRRWGDIPGFRGLNQEFFARRWRYTQWVALLCWLPWSVPFVIQTIGVDREFWMPAPTWTFIRETLHTFHIALQPTVPVPWWVVDLIYGGCFLLGCWRLRKHGVRLGLLLSLCLVPLVVALLVSLRRPIFFDRIFLWATLPYYLLIGAGIGQLHCWLVRVGTRYTVSLRAYNLAVGSLLLLLVALNGQALHNYYANFVKEGWDRAAAYVAGQAAPDDLLLFNATWIQLPFVYYLRHEPIYP